MHDYNLHITSIRFVFIALNFIGLFITWHYSKKIKRSNDIKLRWKYAVPIILSYAVTMGLRFGRMVDYNVYYDRYVSLAKDLDSYDYEFVFETICWVLGNLGIPYWFFICLCSVLVMFAFLHVVVNNYWKYAPLTCVLFFWEAHNVELLIRYYLAFSFILLAFSFYKLNKLGKSIIFCILGIGTHIGMIVFLFPAFLLIFYKKCLFPPIVVAVLFIAGLIVGDIRSISFLSSYITVLDILGEERVSFYTSGFNDLINGELGYVGFKPIAILSTIVRNVMQYLFPILLAPLLVKKKMLGYIEVNLFYIGVIVFPMFTQIEILDRLASSFLFFTVFVSGCAYHYLLANKRQFTLKQRWLCYLSIIAGIWPVISNIIIRTDWWQMLYIWDAGDWNTIPLRYFQFGQI